MLVRSHTLSVLILALAAALLAGVPATAGSPHGLLWNHTGLPAVFPLQVQTLPGADQSLLLIDEATGEAVLAAFIEGGRFFRVLVPPGSYRVRLVAGDIWAEDRPAQGEVFELAPMTFEATGLGRKAGYRIDLRGAAGEAEVTSQGICQTLRLDLDSIELPWGGPGQPPAPGASAAEHLRGEDRYPAPEYDVVSRPCD